jgi:hypothetical protein
MAKRIGRGQLRQVRREAHRILMQTGMYRAVLGIPTDIEHRDIRASLLRDMEREAMQSAEREIRQARSCRQRAARWRLAERARRMMHPPKPMERMAFPANTYTYCPKGEPRYVTVYLVTREYGGPEEGGWYYDHYATECRVSVRNRAHAKRVMDELAHRYGFPTKQRDYTSVLSNGMYEVRYEHLKGERQTTQRPYYE